MKKGYIFVIVLLILIVGVLIVDAAVTKTRRWQPANKINVNISTGNIDLQQAINDGLLVNPSPGLARSTDDATKPSIGHSFDEILVSVRKTDGTILEIPLKDAIPRTDICGGTSINPDTITSGHSASEIEVDISGVIKNLQEAINAEDVLYTKNSYKQCNDDDVYWFDSCNNRENKDDECNAGESMGSNYCGEVCTQRCFTIWRFTRCFNVCVDTVYANPITNSCSGDKCESVEGDPILQDTCTSGCLNGVCNTPPPPPTTGTWVFIDSRCVRIGDDTYPSCSPNQPSGLSCSPIGSRCYGLRGPNSNFPCFSLELTLGVYECQ